MTYPPLRQLKSDLSRLELILMMAVAASNPSATPTLTSKPCSFNMQAGKLQAANMRAGNMQAARQLFET
jgi:hypothetical protein